MRKLAVALLALTLLVPAGTIACGAATRGSSASGGSSVSGTIDDATITTRVKTALLNDPAKLAGIDVQTFKGVVTLSGRVKTKDEESKAVAVARGIRGVTEVKSTLQIQ
jgi:hyperosmotically inducible protein